MDLDLTEEQQRFRDRVRVLVAKEVASKAAEIDRKCSVPRDLLLHLSKAGLMGVAVPRHWGGAGVDTVAYVLALEEVAAGCASTALMLAVQNLVCDVLLAHGSDEQKDRWLAPIASGNLLASFALTEPQAGSDAAALSTLARRDGGGWKLCGRKSFVTNGPVADVVLLSAVTEPNVRHHGISLFLVPRNTPGLSFGPNVEKLGVRGAPAGSLTLEDCFVSSEALVGAEGQGFKMALAALDGGRIAIAAQATGIARAAFQAAAQYSMSRRTFGQPLVEHQAIQFKLADMRTEIDAAHLMTCRAAVKKDAQQRCSTEASQAKLFASEMANRVAREAVQVFGGYGCLTEQAVERHFRDAKITEIYEGTSEIQRLTIASALLSV